MSINPTPRRIEWNGPEGWTVWADEDGVHLRASGSQFTPCLEQPDVQRLFDLWTQVRASVAADHIAAPKVPTPEEIRLESAKRAEESAKRRAVKAITAEFNAEPF